MASSKADLVRKVQSRTGFDVGEARMAIDAVFRGIQDLASDGEPLVLKGFGTFRIRTRKASRTRNPRTGEPMDVPASSRLGFKPSKEKSDAHLDG